MAVTDLSFNTPSSLNTNFIATSQTSVLTLNSYAEAIDFYNAGELSEEHIRFIFAEASFNSNYFPISFEIQKVPLNIPYSDTLQPFNNNFLPFKRPKLSYLEETWFINEIIVDDSTTNKYKLDLIFSGLVSFYNNKDNFERNDLLFSTGIFPFEEKFYALMDDNVTFEYIDSLRENISMEYYWFDNSIPSYAENLQSYVIPWGNRVDNMQVAYKFPYYDTNFEFDISSVSIKLDTNLETDIYPKRHIDEIYNIEFDTIFSSFAINYEFARGSEMKTLLNLEMFWDPVLGEVRVLPIEFNNIINTESKIVLEYSAGWPSTDILNIEFDEYISAIGVTNMEFSKGFPAEEDINLEFNRDLSLGTNYICHHEFSCYVDRDKPLDLEYTRVYNDDYSLDMQFRKVQEEFYDMNIETLLGPSISEPLDIEIYVETVSKSLNLEYSRVYPIDEITELEVNVPFINNIKEIPLELNIFELWADVITNLEFTRVYNDIEYLNYEFGIDYMTHNFCTNLEASLATHLEREINIEILKPKEAKVNQQTYVIPWGFKNNFFQVTHVGTQKLATDMEFNITGVTNDRITNLETGIVILTDSITNLEIDVAAININEYINLEMSIPDFWTDKVLPLEFQHVYKDDFINFVEFDTSINKDYILNLETDISINTAYELTMEYSQIITDSTSIDIEMNTVINTDVDLNIEYIIDRLSHDFNLPLEYFISINTNFMLDLELFIGTVSKSLNLEIDVLDLVYYFIRKGHNILPWGYSDGKGNWDTTVNKNWNKQNDDNTLLTNGLLNQIQEKGLTIPDIISFSNEKLENWGTIIKGKQEDDITLSNKFLYYESINDEYILVMGKRKRDPIETVELKEGENLVIWDGLFKANEPAMFNTEIKPQIESFINNTQVWDQRLGEWKTLVGNIDHPLYFEQLVEDTLQPMPYILNIKVNSDCSFTINR